MTPSSEIFSTSAKDVGRVAHSDADADKQMLSAAVFDMMNEKKDSPQKSDAKRTSDSAKLMPLPVSMEETGEKLAIGGGVKIEFSGISDPVLQKAGDRFMSHLQLRTGLLADASLPGPTIKIDVAKTDANFGTVKESEAYKLTVDSKGVVIQAEGQAGALHGLSTLMQLVKLGPDGFEFTGARIEDQPRFAWRGLLIDVARHFVTVDTLKRQIDAMEAVKLNVLHLHLSDNEAFRVESKKFPLLHEKASGGQYYTQDQIKELVSYAAERGVRIVPEFDMPGHSGSEVRAYPEIGTPMGAGKPPDGVLDPSRESTYKFVEAFIDEMSKLFPDAYYHMGGDEVGGGSWKDDPHVSAFMKEKGFKDTAELQSYFTNRVKEMLDKQGKTMIGWDEIVNPGLSQNVLVHSWRSSRENVNTLKAGYPMIISNGYYLDMLSPSSTHYRVDPTDTRGGNNEENWGDGPKNPDEPPVKLTPAEEKLILGGEGAMWSELATNEQMDARIWPRMAAVAERYWSPSTVRDTDDMYRRLISVDNELSVLGLDQHQNPERMAARLAPENPEVIMRFLSAFRPSTNWSHFKSFRANWNLPHEQQFNELADIASPDTLSAKKLDLEVKDYLDKPDSNVLLLKKVREQFEQWRDNHEQFMELAKRSKILSDAAPRSQDLYDLSQAALEAIDMIKSGKAPNDEWLKKQNKLLDAQVEYDINTASMVNVQNKPQPPADLLLAIHPTVRLLVNAAAKLKK